MNPSDIPVIINNFNRLDYVQLLIDWLLRAGTERIVILDNASTFPPLLQWYAKKKDKRIQVRRLGSNYGSQALWMQPDKSLLTLPFVYTDPDVVPDDDCPKDLVTFLLKTWEACSDKFRSSWDNKKPQKIDPGLKVSDIPDCYALRERVLAWEKRHAGPDKIQAEHGGVHLYDVAIDTTFALYVGYAHPFGLSAVRTGDPYVIKHLSWYCDSANPTAEERYYEAHANKRVTNWGIKQCYSEAVNRLYSEKLKEQENKGNEGNMAKKSVQKTEQVEQPRMPKQVTPWLVNPALKNDKAMAAAVITPYNKVPMAIDMACYADFYKGVVQDVLMARNGDDVQIVDVGVRYGCSSRIFRDAIGDRANVKLALIDSVVTTEAYQLTRDKRVTFLKQKGEFAGHYFEDESIDILHLDVDSDGTHPYELSFDSLLAFWQKLKPDARVIIHDATDHFPGVQRLVKELVESGWVGKRCEPRPECPIAAPVVLQKKETTMSFSPITAVIPVIQEKWLGPLLASIAKMKTQPEEIIVIDNANGAVSLIVERYQKKLNIKYLPQKENIGVNASWNLGLAEAKADWVTFLNDDIVLPSRFFSALQYAILSYQRAGYIIPSTFVPQTVGKRFSTWSVGLPSDAQSSKDMPSVVRVPIRDGGWAMTVKKDLGEPIPKELFTFAGDDFWFQEITTKGYWALRLLNTSVFHHVGISLDKPMREKLKLPPLEQDLGKWAEIKANMGKVIG